MKINKIFAILISLFWVGILAAQMDIITPKEFSALVKSDPDIVILDVSKAKTYASSHVKNAVSVDHNDLYKDGPVKGLIKSPEALADYFGKLGVGDQSKVVVYDEGSQKYSSRVYWILKYLGKEDVTVLHKDLAKWRSARILLTASSTKLDPQVLTPRVNSSVFATTKEVAAKKDNPNFMLVDVRTADEFNGIDKSDGHIPGAINLNYEDLLTDNGAFKSASELQKIADTYGLTNDKEIVFYCKTSIRATVSFIAFKNILGCKNVKVYDGAYNEWAASHSIVQ
jgi:thiosulfate/3-mercaptopyruvate sulfurtransferase